MKKVVKAELLINLQLEYDLETEELSLISCTPNLMSTLTTDKVEKVTHIISETQQKFGILTLGSKHEVGKMLPLATEIFIEVNGQIYTEKKIATHKTTRGRIDGLTGLYSKYPQLDTGKEINVEYEPNDKILKIQVE